MLSDFLPDKHTERPATEWCWLHSADCSVFGSSSLFPSVMNYPKIRPKPQWVIHKGANEQDKPRFLQGGRCIPNTQDAELEDKELCSVPTCNTLSPFH